MFSSQSNFLKNFSEVQRAAGFWLAARTAPTCPSTPARTVSAPGPAGGGSQAPKPGASPPAWPLPAPMRPRSGMERGGSLQGPALSCPRSGTAPASWGSGGREPGRHAVEEQGRCRRLSRRSPAAAAGSLLPPGPAWVGASGSRERPLLLHLSAVSPPARRETCPPVAGICLPSNAQREWGKVSRLFCALFSNWRFQQIKKREGNRTLVGSPPPLGKKNVPSPVSK